jgi:hypothetical protein
MKKVRFSQIVLGAVLGAALAGVGMQLLGGGSTLAESLPVEATHAGSQEPRRGMPGELTRGLVT